MKATILFAVVAIVNVTAPFAGTARVEHFQGRVARRAEAGEFRLNNSIAASKTANWKWKPTVNLEKYNAEILILISENAG